MLMRIMLQFLFSIYVVKKILFTVQKKIKIGKNVKIKFVKDRPGHDMRYAINSSKLKKKLKWKPKTNFSNGYQEAISFI